MKKWFILFTALFLVTSCGLFDDLKSQERELDKDELLFHQLEQKTEYKSFESLEDPIIILVNHEVSVRELDGTAFIIWDWKKNEVYDWCFSKDVRTPSLTPMYKIKDADGKVLNCLADLNYAWITFMDPAANKLDFLSKTKRGHYSYPDYNEVNIPSKALFVENVLSSETDPELHHDDYLLNVYDNATKKIGKTFTAGATPDKYVDVFDSCASFVVDSEDNYWFLKISESTVFLCKVDTTTNTVTEKLSIPRKREIDVGEAEPYEQLFDTNLIHSGGDYVYIDSRSLFPSYRSNPNANVVWLENFLYRINVKTMEVTTITYTAHDFDIPGDNNENLNKWSDLIDFTENLRLLEYNGQLYGIFSDYYKSSFVTIDFDELTIEEYKVNNEPVVSVFYHDSWSVKNYFRGSRIYYITLNWEWVDGLSDYQRAYVTIGSFDFVTNTNDDREYYIYLDELK